MRKEKMKKLYKLTDENCRTRNDTQWGPGVSHSGTGVGKLCSPGWVHAYEHPLIAALLNPIHADFKNPRLWEAEGEVAIRDGQVKCGCKTLTTTREIPLPEITTEMRVRFAILCAKQVAPLAPWEAWNTWADKWLSGENRSDAEEDAVDIEVARLTREARTAALAAKAAKAEAEAWESARAAARATREARAAERAAKAAEAEAWAEAWASDARTAAMDAAARAADAAATAGTDIDLVAIAEKACRGR